MTSIKALCVLLFLFLRIDKSLNLKNNSSPAKRTIVLEKVKQNAHKIGKTIRRKLREPGLGNIYIGMENLIHTEKEFYFKVSVSTFIQTVNFGGGGGTSESTKPAEIWRDKCFYTCHRI